MPARALATLRDELIAIVYRASSLTSNDPSRHWYCLQGKDYLNPKLATKRISSEDIINYIHKNNKRLMNMLEDVRILNEQLEETLNLYLSKTFNEDQVAKLDQAGETDPDRSTLLRQVFTDLELKPREGPSPSFMLKGSQLHFYNETEQPSEETSTQYQEKVRKYLSK